MSESDNTFSVALRRLKIFFTLLWSGFRLISFRTYWKDGYMRSALALSVAGNVFSWVYPLWHRQGSDGSAILHYNFLVGVDFIGSFDLVFILPMTGLLILLFNSVMASAFYKDERLAAYLLTMSAVLVQFFLAVAIYLLVQING